MLRTTGVAYCGVGVGATPAVQWRGLRLVMLYKGTAVKRKLVLPALFKKNCNGFI
jgi:hypothetical protein